MVVAKDDRSPLAAWRRFDRPNRASLRVTLTSLRNELAGGRKKITTIPRSLRSELVGPVAGARLKYSKKETLSLSLFVFILFFPSKKRLGRPSRQGTNGRLARAICKHGRGRARNELVEDCLMVHLPRR